MARDLTQGEYVLGMAGLGLLRLHRSGDSSDAPAIRDELASMLDHVDEPPFDEDLLGRHLDLRTGYARWATVYDLPGKPVIDHEQPVVRTLLDRLPGSPVLDAACGTGLSAVAAAERPTRGRRRSAPPGRRLRSRPPGRATPSGCG